VSTPPDLVRRILAFSRPQTTRHKHLQLQPVIAEALKTYEGVAMPQEQRSAIDRTNALSLFPQFA